MKDNFSTNSADYAKYRPRYPDELLEFILRFVTCKSQAWDCATGNGQTAAVLARHFEKVYATDISFSQLNNAVKVSNIKYIVEASEQTSIPDNSIDLVTVSQALHWFNIDKFYAEVRRVSKPTGIIAVWTYRLLKIDVGTDKLIDRFHFETLANYWDYERVHVNNGYINIHFTMLEGYLNTWSAVPKFISENNYNPVTDLIQIIKRNWAAGDFRSVRFPLTLKIGSVF